MEETVLKVISLIRNGVPMEEGTRPFDVIDYYEIVNMYPSVFDKVVVSLCGPTEVRDYKDFAYKNLKGKLMRPFALEDLLMFDTEVNMQKDSDGNLLRGTGRIITKAEKMLLIEYMEAHNIPLNVKTYSSVFNRYKNDLMFLTEEKTLAFKK